MLYHYPDQESLPSSFPSHAFILGKVDHVIDGDSLVFNPISLFYFLNHKKSDSKISLRLAGIDAPETPKKNKEGQPFGIESKEFLGKTVNKIILIKPFSKDQYGRLVGMAYDFPLLVPWIRRNLALESLKNGLSVVYHGMGSEYGDLKDSFLKAQEEASKGKKGIWSLESFETPGQFKKRNAALAQSEREIPYSWFLRNVTIHGRVTKVGDGDGFRLLHVPKYPLILSSNTLSVRLAGVDAPEMGHFGKTPQPYSKEAKEWLSNYIEGKNVSVKLLEMDQYERIVGSVTVDKKFWWLFAVKRNVSLEMVRLGFACVYEGVLGSFDGMKDQLLKAETDAKRKRIGMWSQSNYESPMQYKKRTKT